MNGYSFRLCLILILSTLGLLCQAGWPDTLSDKAKAYLEETDETAFDPNPQFCFVIRTYWGHGSFGDDSLVDLLQSLQHQKYQKWEALLVVADDRPFKDLHELVMEMEDERIWVFAEWIHKDYKPRQGLRGWSPGYHTKLYALTDEAIRACPPDTRWVVVTNGDNLYASNFLEKVIEAGNVDAVGADYYSRYQRPTAPPCERFQAAPGAPACKVNRFKWCHTDLGASAYHWPKLIKQNLLFAMAHRGNPTDFAGQDGVFNEHIVSLGWKIKHLSGQCLFDHSPSPQRCARNGGVWDDREAATHQHTAGRCIQQKEAEMIMQKEASKTKFERINVEVTHDGNLGGFKGAEGQSLMLPCLRRTDERFHRDMMEFFGHGCVEDMDMAAFQASQQHPHQAAQQRESGKIEFRNKNSEPSYREKMEGWGSPKQEL